MYLLRAKDSDSLCYFSCADFVRKRVNLALLSGGVLDSTALAVRSPAVCGRVVGEMPQVRAGNSFAKRPEEAQSVDVTWAINIFTEGFFASSS